MLKHIKFISMLIFIFLLQFSYSNASVTNKKQKTSDKIELKLNFQKGTCNYILSLNTTAYPYRPDLIQLSHEEHKFYLTHCIGIGEDERYSKKQAEQATQEILKLPYRAVANYQNYALVQETVTAIDRTGHAQAEGRIVFLNTKTNNENNYSSNQKKHSSDPKTAEIEDMIKNPRKIVKSPRGDSIETNMKGIPKQSYQPIYLLPEHRVAVGESWSEKKTYVMPNGFSCYIESQCLLADYQDGIATIHYSTAKNTDNNQLVEINGQKHVMSSPVAYGSVKLDINTGLVISDQAEITVSFTSLKDSSDGTTLFINYNNKKI